MQAKAHLAEGEVVEAKKVSTLHRLQHSVVPQHCLTSLCGLRLLR